MFMNVLMNRFVYCFRFTSIFDRVSFCATHDTSTTNYGCVHFLHFAGEITDRLMQNTFKHI